MSKYWVIEDEYEAYEITNFLEALDDKDNEIERLNNKIKELEQLNQANYLSFIQCNNIINELEKYLSWVIEYTLNNDEKGTCKSILDKLKELKKVED